MVTSDVSPVELDKSQQSFNSRWRKSRETVQIAWWRPKNDGEAAQQNVELVAQIIGNKNPTMGGAPLRPQKTYAIKPPALRCLSEAFLFVKYWNLL